MTKSSKTLVFFGNERLSSGFSTTAPTLIDLIKAGYRVKAVVVNQAKNSKRKLEIADVATKNGIPVLTPDKPDDVLTTLQGMHAEFGILSAYGKIIPKEVINTFPYGILNIHPSLLPNYRGSTPIEQTILDGAEETGVSIMQLASKMDAGPIYAQKIVALTGQEQKQELTEKLQLEGTKLLLTVLPNILSGQLQPKAQDGSMATYCSLISKASGLIDWQKPAITIEREIRAYQNWPSSYTKIGGLNITICQVIIAYQKLKPGELLITTNKLFIGCGSGSLQIIKVKPVGKKVMGAKDLINGYKQKLTNSG